MITDLTVTNYRCFESFKLTGLTRVNLFVGKNGSGKTSLLEAVNCNLNGGSIRTLLDAQRNRGETSPGVDKRFFDISHLFYGHRIESGSGFSINSDAHRVRFTVEDLKHDHLSKVVEASESDETINPPSHILRVQRVVGSRHGDFELPVFGTLLSVRDVNLASAKMDNGHYHGRPNRTFTTPYDLNRPVMTEMWNRLKVSRNASRVIEALKIIDPRVEDIFFEVTDSSERLLNPNSGIRVGLQNHQSLVPLGTLGNGMSHLLHLAVVLVHMSDGFATVDEVETGLHYSLMADLWELVVKTAVESNTQVFATTHSADCIRGLGYFCEDHPEFQDQVSVHRIEPSLGQGIRLGGSEVVQAVEHEIEIR